MDGRNRCCGVGGGKIRFQQLLRHAYRVVFAGCAYPTVAYVNTKTGQPLRCRQGGLCPQGYICKPTSSGAYVCCSASVSVEEEEEEPEGEEREEAEPEEGAQPKPAKGTSATVAPKRLPRCANEVEESEEAPATCNADKPDSCPGGYECEMAANVEIYVCCKASSEFEFLNSRQICANLST